MPGAGGRGKICDRTTEEQRSLLRDVAFLQRQALAHGGAIGQLAQVLLDDGGGGEGAMRRIPAALILTASLHVCTGS